MKSDTADQHWNDQWKSIEEDSNWLTPEKDVQEWATGLARGARILDLGAGVGRDALWLTARGFDLIALDAAPGGLAEIDKTVGVETVLAHMDALPFKDHAFDHVLDWDVIYHGDEDILLRTIAEICRVLKPSDSYMRPMLSKRRLPHEQAKYAGREFSHNAWFFDVPGTDKMHPHYFCAAADLLALFSGFEYLKLEDREHEKLGTFHWHLTMEGL